MQMLTYAGVVPIRDNRVNLRITVAPAVAEAFDALCDHKRISKQDAVDGLLTWVLTQDELIQSMVLGQIKASPDLVEVVLRRLAAPQLPQRGHRVGGSRPQVGGA